MKGLASEQINQYIHQPCVDAREENGVFERWTLSNSRIIVFSVSNELLHILCLQNDINILLYEVFSGLREEWDLHPNLKLQITQVCCKKYNAKRE